MLTLLNDVRSRVFIHAHRRSRALLDGGYGSTFKGRSLDFEDLRAYAPGDEVRDIDWKATARHGAPLIRRYVAARHHNVLFVVPTGCLMSAVTEAGESRLDATENALGVLRHIAIRHGDPIGMVSGPATSTTVHPFNGSETQLEVLLRAISDIDPHSVDNASGALLTQLEYVSRHIRRRTLLVVIADEPEAGERLEALLGRLRASVVAQYRVAENARREAMESLLRRTGTASSSISGTPELVAGAIALLEKHRRGTP
ncbi:DUF58 domain-containing protein [Arthrobacter roseus]|uniref:DUF58 domain-containing protein n=1 Tax=Arthrobacter roseus TaxID=136274 RepID=UPI0019664F06|nr:DUF58 domain-containing protein [Arthrobacter roseus]MBM7848759.1 uncharacterized protein (DUF58 family) [Arthrobacter roseus]